MPDSWLVTGNLYGVPSPGPTTLELASYVIAEQGIDFDAGALFQNQYSQNPARDGGALAFSQSGVRRFTFPLRLASSWPGPNGLGGIEDHLRRLVRTPNPGYIDLLPENASYAIRFDILDGRVKWDTYNAYRQKIARRDVTLELDVQPFGYLPTTITLASAGLATAPITITFNPASIIGDVPALAEIVFRATGGTSVVPSVYAGAGGPFNFKQDALWWSLSRASGATALLSPSAFVFATNMAVSASHGWMAATHQPDVAAPLGLSLSMALSASMNTGQWLPIALASFSDTKAALYRGRFRVLGHFRTGAPSIGIPWQLSADIAPAVYAQYLDMASSNPIATLIPGQATLNSGQQNPASVSTWIDAPSGMFQILDFGEMTFPPMASGNAVEGFTLRLWAQTGTTNMGVPSPHVEFGGLYLQALDTMSGIIPRGINQPSTFHIAATSAGLIWTSNVNTNMIRLDGINRNLLSAQQDDLLGAQPLATWQWESQDLRRWHVGPMPEIATSVSLDAGIGDRTVGFPGATGNMVRSNSTQLAASIRYRPRFSFLRGF